MLKSFLLANFLTVSLISTTSEKWIEVGTLPLGKYEVNLNTVQFDKSQGVVQLDTRFTFIKPTDKIKYVLQNVLLLCKEDIMIDMTQVAYDEKNIKVTAETTAKVYHNPHNGSMISDLLQYSCGDTLKVDPVPQRSPEIERMGTGRRYTT